MYGLLISMEKSPSLPKGNFVKLQHYHTQCGKYKVNISLYRKKIYQRTDLEELQSRFDQIIPIVSNLEVLHTENLTTPITL